MKTVAIPSSRQCGGKRHQQDADAHAKAHHRGIRALGGARRRQRDVREHLPAEEAEQHEGERHEEIGQVGHAIDKERRGTFGVEEGNEEEKSEDRDDQLDDIAHQRAERLQPERLLELLVPQEA